MNTLARAALIPVAVCFACSGVEESRAANAPAAGATPAPAPAAAAGTPTSAVLAAEGSGAAPKPPVTAKVNLIPASGSSVKGDLALADEGLAVRVRGEITGLAPGAEHGFHVHEIGQCSLPDFTSAGAHLNPAKDPHGGPDTKARHLGDLLNAKADNEGRARIDFSIKGAKLVDKDGGPNQIVGKALVVHAMPDDYKTQPSGGSGDRIACGVIRAAGG